MYFFLHTYQDKLLGSKSVPADKTDIVTLAETGLSYRSIRFKIRLSLDYDVSWKTGPYGSCEYQPPHPRSMITCYTVRYSEIYLDYQQLL